MSKITSNDSNIEESTYIKGTEPARELVLNEIINFLDIATSDNFANVYNGVRDYLRTTDGRERFFVEIAKYDSRREQGLYEGFLIQDKKRFVSNFISSICDFGYEGKKIIL